MPLTIRLAVRDWDYLTPLALGDVRSDRIDLVVNRVASLPDGVGAGQEYDAAETSFSRYLTAIAAGEQGALGLPNFVMRGFRHQCIITREDSPLTTIRDLAGKRIGVTGWQDSGNVWTRAILRREGITTEDAFWYAGRLTESHPVQDRLGNFGRPGRIEPVPHEAPMMALLDSGWLDAVCTPFMPEGFFDPKSGFRQLLPDCRAEQVRYFNAVGYVPGIHLVSLDAELANAHPWLATELSGLIDRSRAVWTAKRRRYVDTTPFMHGEMKFVAEALPDGWDASGLDANRRMIAEFITEMRAQEILPRELTVDEVFPFAGKSFSTLNQPTEMGVSQ
ncbi:MAG: ABC transporter substrate-binding protein [Rhodobacteraceae bacterium]|nr:ABC transporter substrate-binding protein [Paracoccaceae bacterium]